MGVPRKRSAQAPHTPSMLQSPLFPFFFFSCGCLTLHGVFTRRTGTARPSWQPAACPGKGGSPRQPQQLVPLWHAPENQLTCPWYQGWTMLSRAQALPSLPEHRPEASSQHGGFPSPKYSCVVEREDFCQATSFLLRQVNAACDGLSYS